MPLNIALFGVQGSGKGTQAERMIKKYDSAYLYPGAMYREAIANQTEIGKIAQQFINDGNLVPDDVTNRMMKEAIEGLEDGKGVILDGYPRTNGQADALGEVMELTHVLVLEITDEEAVIRLENRRVCTGEEKHIYHLIYNPSKEEGKCDHDGTELIQRDDDQPDAIRKRIETYHEQTVPVYDRYEKQGILHRIDGSGTPDETQAAIEQILG